MILKNISVFIINEQPNQVKNPCEITDHEDDVNGFDNGIKHLKNLCAKIKDLCLGNGMDMIVLLLMLKLPF